MITLHAHAGMPKERDREVTATTNSRQLLILDHSRSRHSDPDLAEQNGRRVSPCFWPATQAGRIFSGAQHWTPWSKISGHFRSSGNAR